MRHSGKMVLLFVGLALLGDGLGQPVEGRAMPLKGVTVVAPDAYWQKPTRQPPFCSSMDAVLLKMLQMNENWGLAAAVDLTNALTKVTGAPVALVRESAAHAFRGPVLHLGETQAAKDAGLASADMKKAEWRIACDGLRAFICSSTGMGVAYGVTDFLSRYAGYRFLTIDGDDPFEVRPDAAVPVCDFRRHHAIYARHFSSFDRNHPKTSLAYLPAYLRRLGLQLSPEVEPQVRPSVACGGYCHTWLRYCPPEKYAKEHPEYYSLFDDGTRHTSAPTMLCLSNPDVLEIVTSRMLACIAEDRAKYGKEAPTLYDFSQPDCCDFICRCADCRARAERHGGDMGLQLTFVNALARRVREKHPDVTIRIFAYVSTEKIPVGIRPEPNVMIWLCDLYSRSDHQLPLTHPFNRERHDLVRDWKAIAPSFELWDYMLTEDDFPQVSVDALAADARYFHALGIDRIYHESQMGGQAFWELEYYVLSRMYLDPTADLERTIDEYCAVYGRGAAEMRRAIDYLRKVIAENPPKSVDSWHRRGLPWRTIDVMEGFRRSVRLAYAAEDRPKMRARIALALQTVDQELYRLGGGRTPEGQARLREEFLACAAAVRDGGFYHPSERQEAYRKTVRKFQQANLRFARLPKALEGVPSSDLKCFDTTNTGIWSREQRRVADPDSECGKALRVVPDAGEASIGWVLARDADTKRADRLPLALERSETYRWYRLGVSRVGRSSDVYVPVHVGFRLDGQYVECDGLAEDPNWYEYWISVKWNGDARAAELSKGLFIDRLLLRRVPAPSPPPPPAKKDWGFMKDLATPPERAPRERFALVDRYGCGEALRSAREDLADFLGGTRELVLARGPVDGRESYRVDVTPARVTLTAEDDEGLRRAIYHFEDRVQAGDLASVMRKPWLRHRFSRGFFAPTKRPPLYTDELTDDVDYYPDAYLNRLAHEGVNAIWITVMLRDLAETSFTARAPDAERRLAKLARTAEKLSRYGIGLWLFAIEPRRVPEDDPFRRAHPELFRRFSPSAKSWVMCPSEPDTRRYVEESMRDIFTRVPKLAGLVNISHGERDTTCLSALHPTGARRYMTSVTEPCPRCRDAAPAQLHAAVCAAFVRGMRAGNPKAEMFSWYYHPQPAPWRAQWVKDVARQLPDGVTFVYNFESGVCQKQVGRLREGGDYWLANAGPAEPFREIAASVRDGGGRLAAKTQTGCGFEIATVPYLPVPGLLWRKYRAMRELGVDSVMQCWLVGSYPGVQNKAAGELAFEDFTGDEPAFLRRLAAPTWGDQAEAVAKVWEAFSRAYAYYPLSNNMQYYGPFNESVAWPLYPDVEMKPIWASWKPHFPVSGDVIGDALDTHTLEEALLLMERMCDLPDLRGLRAETAEQRREIGLLRAVQLHFESGRNVYEFYWQRRRALTDSRLDGDAAAAVAAIDRMRALVSAEKAVAAEMRVLSSADARLGFHPEAERYKYYPALFDWRIERLTEAERRLDEIRAVCARGEPYPESTFEKTAPVCRVNGPEFADKGLSWRVTGDARGLTVQGTCSPGVANDAVHVAFLDVSGTTFADFYDIRRDGLAPLSAFRTPDETRAVCTIRPEADGGWSFTLTLDSWKWNRDRARRPAWIYVRRPATGAAWPKAPQDGVPRHERLNQDVAGDEFGRLLYAPASLSSKTASVMHNL